MVDRINQSHLVVTAVHMTKTTSTTGISHSCAVELHTLIANFPVTERGNLTSAAIEMQREKKTIK